MSKNYQYNLWISVGADSGISFATIGQLAKESSMMQGILLSLQSLMSTEIEVSESQFMTGQNEYARFGTFTLPYEDTNVVVQYVLKSAEPNQISSSEELLVQELALSFCKYIMLTPEFRFNLDSGRVVSRDHVSSSFLNACTITHQKIPVKVDRNYLFDLIVKELKLAEKNIDNFPTLQQLQNLDEWLGTDESSWDRGSISSFKRQLILQLFSRDLLNNLIDRDPLAILEYERPRFIVEEVTKKIEDYLNSKDLDAQKLINDTLGSNIEKIANKYLSQLTIDEIHSSESFVANFLVRDIILKLSKNNPLLALKDYRTLNLFNITRDRIKDVTSIMNPGTLICDAIQDELEPAVSQSSKLFLTELIKPFSGKRLPSSIWSVITDFVFSILEEEKIDVKTPKVKKKKDEAQEPSIQLKRRFLEERIKKLNVPQSKWKDELIAKFKEYGLGKQLQISNVEETVIFAKALEKAVISSLEKVIHDQLFNSDFGDIFRYTTTSYRSLASKTVLGNILTHIIDNLEKSKPQNVNQYGIIAKDIIASIIEEGEVKAYINSIPIKLKKPIFGKKYLSFDNRTISTSEIMIKHSVTIEYSNHIKLLKEVESDCELLAKYLLDPIILKRSYGKAFLRGVLHTYIEPIFQFQDSIIEKLDAIINTLQKQLVSSLKPAHMLPELKTTFPSLGKNFTVPPQFKTNPYHEKSESEWNNLSSKTHKVIQELLSDFTELKQNDLHYKKKAMKLYDHALKEFQKIRKALNKKWNRINKEVNENIEKISISATDELIPHLNTIKTEGKTWIAETFKIKSIEPGQFTVSDKQCYNQLISDYGSIIPQELGELPKNFVEIALSILLFKRIPDYVIDASYSQMISKEKKAAKAVRKAWAKSTSRKEFESNLYLNMRILGNTLIDTIYFYGRNINRLFIKNDLEISTSKDGFYIDIAEIPKSVYQTKTELGSIFNFPNLEFYDNKKQWIVRLFVEPEYNNKLSNYKDRLIVLSDLVRITSRFKFEEKTAPMFEGLKAVLPYLIEYGDKQVIDLTETMKEAMFKLSDYPTMSASEK